VVENAVHHVLPSDPVAPGIHARWHVNLEGTAMRIGGLATTHCREEARVCPVGMHVEVVRLAWSDDVGLPSLVGALTELVWVRVTTWNVFLVGSVADVCAGVLLHRRRPLWAGRPSVYLDGGLGSFWRVVMLSWIWLVFRAED